MSDDLMILSYDLPSVSEQRLQELSETEAQICQLLVSGLSDHEIADARSRSVRTITTQLRALYKKAAVNSRTELIAWLYEESTY